MSFFDTVTSGLNAYLKAELNSLKREVKHEVRNYKLEFYRKIIFTIGILFSVILLYIGLIFFAIDLLGLSRSAVFLLSGLIIMVFSFFVNLWR